MRLDLDSLLEIEVQEDAGQEFYWTSKRRRFVNAFVTHEGDLEAAAREAGFRVGADGTSEHVESLLTLPPIIRAIQAAARMHLQVSGETEFTILQRLVNIAQGNIYDYFDPHFQLKPPEELSDLQKLRVKRLSIKQTRYGQEELIELHDPLTANDRLAKYLGLDLDKEALTPEEFASRVLAAQAAMRDANALEKDDE